jgi:hypothetical protein
MKMANKVRKLRNLKAASEYLRKRYFLGVLPDIEHPSPDDIFRDLSEMEPVNGVD